MQLSDLKWPQNPHSISSFAEILSAPRKEFIAAKALHLQLPFARYVKGDTPHTVRSIPYHTNANAGAMNISLPIAWRDNPFKDLNWCLMLNSGRFLDRFLNGYERTRNKKFLEFPIQFLLDWHRFHIEEKKNRHTFAIDSMAAGIRASRFAYIADKINQDESNIDIDLARKVSEVLVFHWNLFVRDGYFIPHNHSLSALHGFIALFRIAHLSGDVRDAWINEFTKILLSLVDAQFDAQGIHYENSPEYHFFVLRLFSKLSRTGWYEEIPSEFHEKIRRAEAMAPWMRFPDGRVIPIGDTNGSPPPRSIPWDTGGFERSAEVLNHPRYYINRNIDNQRWALLAIKAGHQVKTHRHEDDLSYLWSKNGHDIIVDPAKYGYSYDLERSYVKSIKSHNVIEFTSEGRSAAYPPRSSSAMLKQQQNYDQIDITCLVNDPAVKLTRSFYYIPGQALLVLDRFIADNALDFKSRVNLAADFEACIVNKTIIATDERDNKLYISVESSSPISLTVNKGLQGPLEGWISRSPKKVIPNPILTVKGAGIRGYVAIAYSLCGPTFLEEQPDSLVWDSPVGKIRLTVDT